LGSALVQRLLDFDYAITVLDNNKRRAQTLRNRVDSSRLHVLVGDKRRDRDVKVALRDVDVVVDLAAIVGVDACKIAEEQCFEVNYSATKRLLQLCERNSIERFVFASTCSVYEGCGDRLVSENSTICPVSSYAITKSLAEKHIVGWDGQTEVVVARLSTLCGPSIAMRFDLVLNQMVKNALGSGRIVVNGGIQWRPLLDVRDAASALEHLFHVPMQSGKNCVFNVGSERHNMRIIDLARLVISVLGHGYIETRNANRYFPSYRVDFRRLAETGFEPQYSLQQSILDVRALLDAL